MLQTMRSGGKDQNGVNICAWWNLDSIKYGPVRLDSHVDIGLAFHTIRNDKRSVQ